MEQLLEWMEIIEDVRRHRKVRHSIKGILIVVLFAIPANTDTWEQISDFALWNEDYLNQYIELKNEVLYHDTIQRVMGMIRSENLQQRQMKWQELPDSDEGEKLKKIICVDGKTMCSNKRESTKPCHIVSARIKEDGYGLGQKDVEEKSNEITEKEEYQYYISSLSEDMELFSHAIRGHWAVESMH